MYLAIPCARGISAGTFSATHRAGLTPIHCIDPFGCSLLTRTFNGLWCNALNARPAFTHFVMLHDDVVPVEGGWLDVLVEEMRKSQADVLSVVLPIKDERGLISTAFWNPKTNRMRRLTMAEVCQMPETFDGTAVGDPEGVILPNTGLWICDFTKPWVERVCFTIRDRNFQTPTGEWVSQCFSEDWHFGIQAHLLGLRVCATRAVKCIHKGGFDFPNFEPWGAWKTDEGTNYAPLDIEEGPSMPEPVYEPREKVRAKR